MSRSKRGGRYETSHLVEDQRQPGSRGLVLKNLLGITSQRTMNNREGLEYVRAYSEVVGLYGRTHRFTAQDVCRLHTVWLGPIYPWAGRYRQVNVVKDGFPFAPAREIPRLMAALEKGPLRDFTPCQDQSPTVIARALAVVHVELVLIHPFREGNGRLSRLLAVLMALQAGLPTLDFSPMASGRKRQAYFSAIHAGLGRDYRPMERIFNAVVEWTRRIRVLR